MPDLTPDLERELAAIDDALAGRPVPPDLTELGELALLLREDRPEPTPSFGAELDTKVARGFSSPSPRRPQPGRRWRIWMMPALGAAASVLLVAVLVASNRGGGTGSPSTSGGDSTASAPARSAPQADAAQSDEAAPLSAGTASDALAVPPAPAPGSPRSDGRQARKVERSASLTLAARPRDIDAVSARIQAVTRRQGGFVASSTVSSSTNGGGGTFELRIPTRNLDAAIAALARLGKVRERAQETNDITSASVSARTRLTDARTERSSLLRQLAKATTPLQTASIRARLRIVAHEISVALTSVRRVNNRAAYSTVALTLVADHSAVAPPAQDSWSPGDAAHDALRVLEVAAGVALIALAVGLPLGLVALLVTVSARWGSRRRRERVLDAV